MFDHLLAVWRLQEFALVRLNVPECAWMCLNVPECAWMFACRAHAYKGNLFVFHLIRNIRLRICVIRDSGTCQFESRVAQFARGDPFAVWSHYDQQFAKWTVLPFLPIYSAKISIFWSINLFPRLILGMFWIFSRRTEFSELCQFEIFRNENTKMRKHRIFADSFLVKNIKRIFRAWSIQKIWQPKNVRNSPDSWKNLFVYKGKELDHLLSSTFGAVGGEEGADELDEVWFESDRVEEDEDEADGWEGGSDSGISCSWVSVTSIRPESCWFQLDETNGGKQIRKLTIQQIPMMILVVRGSSKNLVS